MTVVVVGAGSAAGRAVCAALVEAGHSVAAVDLREPDVPGLAGTVAGMVVTYLLPPALALFGTGMAAAAGLAAWAMMALAFQPMLRFYRASPLWGAALPVIGAAYTLFTLQSAVQVWRGRGGMWKGRAQAMAGGA